ncbi:MAG: hypothetical protein ACK5WT_15695 [Betaproteobacteria bacterium]
MARAAANPQGRPARPAFAGGLGLGALALQHGPAPAAAVAWSLPPLLLGLAALLALSATTRARLPATGR